MTVDLENPLATIVIFSPQYLPMLTAKSERNMVLLSLLARCAWPTLHETFLLPTVLRFT